MSTQSKIQYAWLILGVIFAVVGIVGLIGGNMMALLTLAVAGLILWQGTFNMGGLEATKYTIIRDFRLLTLRNPKPAKKKKNTFRVIK